MMYKKAMIFALIMIGGGLLCVPVHADDDPEIDVVNVTVPVSCTLDGTGMDSHVAEINNRDYETEIGSTTLTAYCNDVNGFSIYAIGYSDDTYGNTDLIGQSTEELIPTGTTLDGSVSDWAMKLSTTANATYPITLKNGYGSYSVVPTTYTQVAERQAATDVGTAAIGSVLTATYAASVSPTQVADTYVGKVRYTLVHPFSEDAPLHPETTQASQICYYANANTYEGTMGCQNVSSSVTLLASNFSRDGYGFAGWTNKFDYATNPNQQDIKFYGPQETITLTPADYQSPNNGLSLYAIWIKSAGNLQDTAKVAELCGNTTQNITGSLTTAPTDGTANLSSVSALTDQRDNNTYAIAKLADGKCWMIENLRLESRDTVGQNRFNSSITNESLAQGYGGQFAGLADAEPAWANNITTANSLYSTNGANDTINIGTSDAGYRFPRYNNLNTPANANDRPQNPTSNTFANDNTTVGMYSYGNYYSWPAAIADTAAYSSGDHNTTSICPTGWQLPLGNTSTGDIEQGAADAANKVGGFSYLDRRMGGTGASQSTAAASLRWRKYPVNFVYSGVVSFGSVAIRGSNGYFWSSTAFSSDSAYSLNLGSSNADTGHGTKYNGWSVRCVAPGV